MITSRADQDMQPFAAYLVTGSSRQSYALSWRKRREKNFHGGIAVFNQLTPISTSQMRSLQTTRPVILTIILLVWIGLPVVA
jgi:hypothetical protein